MVEKQLTVVLVEDNADHAILIRRHLASVKERPVALQWVQRLSEGIERVERGDVDAVLLDLGLPDSDPGTTLQRILAAAPDLPIIVLTALDDLEMATRAVHEGAQDYLVKAQISGELIVRALRYAIERKLTEQKLKALNETLEHRVAERTAEAERRADQLRKLASELTLAEERERRRLAEILHDHLQQLLVAAKMNVSSAHSDAPNGTLRETLGRVTELIDESIDASRSLTVELSPPVLYDTGLGAALVWLGRQSHQKYGLDVHVELDERAEPAEEQTRVLLFHAVRELLFNVVKYAKVDNAAVQLKRLDDQLIQLTVRDQGVGFEPAQANLEAVSGGFGLFSIRERLELLGGQMHVESSPGGGTCVRLVASSTASGAPTGGPSPAGGRSPAGDEKARAAREREPSDAAASAEVIRVLVAEDRQILRKSLRRMLEQEPDIRVIAEAADGKAAVELALEHRPDVILMDVSMPYMGGIEATRLISGQLREVRIIGLSMHERDGMADAMRGAGAAAYLPKDGPIEDLIGAIRGDSMERPLSSPA